MSKSIYQQKLELILELQRLKLQMYHTLIAAKQAAGTDLRLDSPDVDTKARIGRKSSPSKDTL